MLELTIGFGAHAVLECVGIEPGRVLDFVGNRDKVPDGYRAMDERITVKAIIEF